MKASPTKTEQSAPTGTKGRSKADLDALSFSDLEIPIEPLLNHEQEKRLGAAVLVTLGRLARWLPQHPAGYRRFLARMQEVTEGGGFMFSWLALRDHVASDFKKASRALARAEKLARAGDLDAAWKTLESGVRVLRTYPLDPETLYQWSQHVAKGEAADSPLDRCPGVERRRRLLDRAVKRLLVLRDRLVMPNFRLVLKEVFRFRPNGMRRSDLFQEGVLGLQRATMRYDPSMKTRFSTYATYWIRQSIRKALIDRARLIRVPQAVQEELRKGGARYEPDELARIQGIMHRTVLFSILEGDRSSNRATFTVEDRSASEAADEPQAETITQLVSDALSDLGGREREVLQCRFGLGGEKPQTLQEIGVRMNLSRERVRQIERAALDRMQKVVPLRELCVDLGLFLPAGLPSNN